MKVGLQVPSSAWRPGLAQILQDLPDGPSPLRAAFDRLDQEISRCCIATNLAG